MQTKCVKKSQDEKIPTKVGISHKSYLFKSEKRGGGGGYLLQNA